MSVNINENKISIKNLYRPEIDGLRAFAVVAVIINHFNKDILPGGYLGVDMFFVISGFVITSSLYQRPSENFRDFISGFYERRIKRLVPALSVFVLITSIAICLFQENPYQSLWTGLTSLFGLSNLYLLDKTTDYFAQSTQLNVFTHTWSLGVEEQFYILFPLLIWFSGFSRQSKNGTRNLFLIVGTLSIASLIGFIYLYPTNQPAAYFLMPTRFWEMASGCLLFIGLIKRKFIEQFFEKISPIFVLSLVIAIMYLPMSWAIVSTLSVVALTLLLIVSLKKNKVAFKFFANPKVVYIGLISYSLYLWHWGVLSISRWTIGIHWWSVPIQLVIIFGLAICSYRCIESPLRKKSWFEKKWKTILFGGGVIVMLSSGLVALIEPLKGKIYTGKRIQLAKPSFKRGEKCIENLSNNTYCYFINNKSQQTIWLIGDSHANSLALAGEKTANSLGMNLKLFSAGATTFPVVRKYHKSHKQRDLKSLDDMRFVEKVLYSQIKEGDIVFLAMRMPYHFGGVYYAYPPSEFKFINEDGSFDSQENSFNSWGLAVVNLAQFVQKKGAKVIIQTPTPEWVKQHRNPRCSTFDKQWFNSLAKINCQIQSKFFIEKEKGLYNHLFEKLNNLSLSHENIYLFDTYKIVCPKSVCSFTLDGIDIYEDHQHIMHEWARDFISPEISKFINDIQNIDE